ncbi:MAG: hypothetical protein Q4E69_07475 [Bacilli bacterium]|nr:hypothetical protein [Bacilli bacterium]
MNTKVLDNYNYGLLMLQKYKVIRTLDSIVDREDVLSLPIINILSLYLMDTNNGDGDILSSNEIKNVKKLIEVYKEHPTNNISIEQKDLKYILNHCRDRRIDKDTNKDIALLLADYNNKLYEDDYTSTIRIDKLEETLDKVN